MKKIVCSLLLLCVGMETAFAADSGARRVKVARDDAARRSRSTSPAAKTRSLSKSPESGRKKWDKTPPPTITLKENIEGLVVFESEDRMDSESQNVAFLAGSVGMTVGSLDASGDGGDDGARGEDYQEEDISDDADGEGPNNSQSGGNRSWFKKKKKKDDEPVGASANPALPAYENVVNKVDDRLVVAGGIVSPGASVLLDAQRQDIQGAEGADGIVAPGYAVDEKAVVVGAALVEPQEGGNLPGDGAGNGIILPPIPGHPLPNVPALGEQLPGQHVGGLTLTLKLDQLARADQEEDHDQNGVVSPRDEDVEDGDSSDRTDLLEDKKPKEKKLIQAGVSRFSQALIGWAMSNMKCDTKTFLIVNA